MIKHVQQRVCPAWLVVSRLIVKTPVDNRESASRGNPAALLPPDMLPVQVKAQVSGSFESSISTLTFRCNLQSQSC